MVIIFDGNNQAWMAHSTMGQKLTNGTVFSMLAMFRNTITKFPGHDVVYVFDGGISKRRLEIHPTYKKTSSRANRSVDMEKTFYAQIEIFTRILDALGIPHLRYPDVEADDVIAIMTDMYCDKIEDNIVIVSSDRDFRQLVDDVITIWNPRGKEPFTIDDFKDYPDEYRDIKEQFLFMKAMMGDPSDNIDGVNGIGKKRAIKIAKKVISVKALPFDGLKGVMARVNEPDNIELIKRNIELITLPLVPEYPEQQGITIPDQGEPDFDQFFGLLEGLDFRSFLKNPEDWKNLISKETDKNTSVLDF